MKANTIVDTSAVTSCPVCQNTNIQQFIDIPSVPVHCNILLDSQEEAKTIPKGSMQMYFCEDCSHVFNKAFHNDLMSYGEGYETSLHFSPHFHNYATDLAQELIDKYDINNKEVLEIACGRGDFLQLLCELGLNKGTGFDPSYIHPSNHSDNNANLEIIPDFYTQKYADNKADLFCCRHAMEHIEQPLDFLQGIRNTLAGHLETVLYFEVPNVLYTLRDLGVWDLIYEHCSYFSAPSFRRLFELAGFDIEVVQERFGGQYLGLEARPSRTNSPIYDLSSDITSVKQYIETFSSQYKNKVTEWDDRISQLLAQGKRVVVWGAGSKGVTFLNIVPAAHQVEYIVDISPNKVDKFVPGKAQKIVTPDFLCSYKPYLVILMNPVYQKEVRDMLRMQGVICDLLVA